MHFSWRSLAVAASLMTGTYLSLAAKLDGNSQLTRLTGPALAISEIQNTTQPSATFQYETGGSAFTFTITANNDGDIWFSMACPDTYSWFAVGTGARMSGSQMWIGYGDGTSTGMYLP